MLPRIPYPRQTRKVLQTSFGGLDRRATAGNGAVRHMTNMTGAQAPAAASRPKRKSLALTGTPHGFYSDGENLFAALGTKLLILDAAGTVTELVGFSDTEKIFAGLGERVLVWPDKVLLKRSGSGWSREFLESTVSLTASFTEGTYAGEDAEANTILAPQDFDWENYFKVGDAVTITGAAYAENNKTPIVREVAGRELRFYENTFRLESNANITVTRAVPDLDFLCVSENRVWGCKGDEIRCSKLGDPTNWNVFDGLATDSWSWSTGTAGDFTACLTFMGYPCFFKEEGVYKVYGSRPANFEAMSAPKLGVLAGAGKSLAVANETLYYLSRAGFMAYTGGVPAPVGDELAAAFSAGAVAGSDGLRYFVRAEAAEDLSAAGGAGEAGELSGLLVYDPRKQVWTREDAVALYGMAYCRGLVGLSAADGQGGCRLVWLTGEPPAGLSGTVEEESVSSALTFADWDMQSFDSKYPVRLWLRTEAEEGAGLTVRVRYNGGEWETAAVYAPGGKGSRYLPIPVRRCERFALRIEADGSWRLHALEWELLTGTEARK